MKGSVQLRGDFGNPAGTGIAKLVVDNLESADAAAAAVDMDTFADNLVLGGFTECNVGDVSITSKTVQYADPPGASVNVDAQLFVTYRKKTDATTRKLTISGIDPASALLENASEGKRLTAAGKATLEGYLDTLFGWTDEAVVLTGKLLIKA